MEQIQQRNSEVTLRDQNELGQTASEFSNSDHELRQVKDSTQNGSLESQNNTHKPENGQDANEKCGMPFVPCHFTLLFLPRHGATETPLGQNLRKQRHFTNSE